MTGPLDLLSNRKESSISDNLTTILSACHSVGDSGIWFIPSMVTIG